MGADGPNNPFLFMKRKGYTVIFTYYDRIKEALNWPFDYVVLENSKLINTISSAYPDIYKSLSKLATNGKITVFVKNSKNDRVDFDDFFGLGTKRIRLRKQLRFDSIPEGFFGIEMGFNDLTGKKTGLVKSEIEYGLTFKSGNLSFMNEGPSVLKIKSNFGSNVPLNECLLCVSIESKGNTLLFLANDLKNSVPTGTWNNHEIVFSLPKMVDEEFMLSAFIWNKGKNTLYYDNFEIFLYQ